MDFKSRVVGIQKWIDKNYYREENRFNKEKLFEQEYLNFQIDDCYNYMENVVGKTRVDIFKILYSTYSQWKIELDKLNIPFYLGVWIYNPRLPKSEIVCAIGKEKIEYYQKKCFDFATTKKEIIDVKDFKKDTNNLLWTEKIDFDILEQWEIDFPKENYESEEDWIEQQEVFKVFIRDSYKSEFDKKGKRYFKNVGEIWTGELISE
jgi:hypothetical protein